MLTDKFLTLEDYQAQIKEDRLETVLESDMNILTQAEFQAEAQMTSYLAVHFDTQEIFNKRGGDRNMVVVMYLVDMVLYHIHSRIAAKHIPQLRNDRYADALKWLEMVAAGKLAPDIPYKSQEEPTTLRFGSAGKNNNFY